MDVRKRAPFARPSARLPTCRAATIVSATDMAGKQREIRKVLIVINSQKDDVKSVVRAIEEFTRARDAKAVSLDFSNHVGRESISDVDLAITLGGDGTLLSCARMLAQPPPADGRFPSSRSTWGTSVSSRRSPAASSWTRWRSTWPGSSGLSERLMLSVTVQRDGKDVASFLGLNEAVVGIRGISRMIRLKIFFSDKYVGPLPGGRGHRGHPHRLHRVLHGRRRAHPPPRDGGVHPHPHLPLHAFQPAHGRAGHGDPARSRSRSRRRRRRCSPSTARRPSPCTRETASSSAARPQKALIIRTDRRSFYEVLRTKLNWAGEPNA